VTDKYKNYAELAAVEKPEAYWVRSHDAGPVLILAPHGGGIEPGTSELAVGIAGEDFSLYLFEGRKQQDNGDLHVTSSHFDEPQALFAVQRCETVIAIHGEDSETNSVYIGGRDKATKERISATLKAAGFDAREVDKPHPAGEAQDNICNRGRSGAGVQLEIAAGLRRTFFRALSPRAERQHTTPAFQCFVEAVRIAVHAQE
jgi:phage replication-related protein YjqB (UPF0714/DUF867 family)